MHTQTYSELCVTLAYITMPFLEPWHIYRLRHRQKSVKQIRWSSKFRALTQSGQFIQDYWRIFRGIDASATLTGTTGWGGWGGGRPHHQPFFKKLKKWPDYVNLWVKFSIQIVFLRVSEWKNSRMCCCKDFFLVFDEMFIEVL